MMQSHQPVPVPEHGYGDDVDHVLITEEQLHNRIAEMADRLSETYADEDDDLSWCVCSKARCTSSPTFPGR